MKPIQNAVTITLAAFIATSTACRPLDKNQPVVVHVYRDRDGVIEPWLSEKMQAFQRSGIRTASGRQIVLATAEPNNYLASLADVGFSLKPELVVLNSGSDAEVSAVLRGELEGATRLCQTSGGCPAFVPSWAKGDPKEAAQAFLTFLAAQKHH